MTEPSSSSTPAAATAAQAPILEVTDLTVGYGAVPVVQGLSLTVHPGEMVTLLGPNGAGKSTTLAAICGDLNPSGGTVKWRGRVATGPAHRRCRDGLAFVMEGRTVIGSLSVVDNLRLGRGSVEAALEIGPELRPLLKRRASLLSGGEQQILVLARALAGEPDLLIVDELSLGLAPIIVDRLMSTLKQATGRGTGVLLVEQHVRKALQVADRFYLLRRGQLALAGDASEYRRRHEAIEALYLSDSSGKQE